MCCSGWIKLVGGDHHGKEAGVAAFSTFALQVEVEDSAEPRLFTEEEMVTMDNEDKEERDMEDFRELQLRVEKKVLAWQLSILLILYCFDTNVVKEKEMQSLLEK